MKALLCHVLSWGVCFEGTKGQGNEAGSPPRYSVFPSVLAFSSDWLMQRSVQYQIENCSIFLIYTEVCVC